MNPSDAGSVVKVVIPDFGPASSSAKFVGWLIGQGDTVLEGERIAEVLIESVLIEIRAPAEGVCRQEWVSAGSDVRPGQVLGQIINASE